MNGASGGGWHCRGYLPHFESSRLTQHVTFHLADSLPENALRLLNAELRHLSPEKQVTERRQRVDAWIDAGIGSCVLSKPDIAEMVQGSLFIFDSQRYRLFAWVVMPNHVHVLFEPAAEWKVATIVASWKKFTARKICDYYRNSDALSEGAVWHREYWDRYIRDRKHFGETVKYIHMNPVKAGLVDRAEKWKWSSAHPGNANLPIGASRLSPKV